MYPSKTISSVFIVPLIALLVVYPNAFRPIQDAIKSFVVTNPLLRLFPDAPPPRSDPRETPILMTSVAHWSHVEKITSIAVELANLGYPITFLSGSGYEEHISSLHPNITFSAFLGLDDKMHKGLLKKYRSTSVPAGADQDQELSISKKIFIDPMASLHETLQIQFRKFREKHGNSKPLIVIYDQMVTGHYPTMLGAPGLKPDVNIGISTSPLTLQSNDTFPFRTGKLPHTGPNAQAIHQAANKEHSQTKFEKGLNEYFWGKLRELGAVQEPFPGVFHAVNALPDYLLTMGIPEFEFPRSDLRPNVRYFGAFKKVGKHVDGKANLPEWWDDIAKAKQDGKKIIAVSQGTVESNPNDLILPTWEALKDRDDVLIIATFTVVDPSQIPDLKVPKNARAAKFVPFDLLLPLVDILISNGGWGGVQHALRLGVPMIVAGVTQDKPTVCAIVQWSGVGIDLKVRQPGAAKIRAAVEKILEDPSYTNKAKALSKVYDRYDVAQTFDGVIQDVVRDWKKGRYPGKNDAS